MSKSLCCKIRKDRKASVALMFGLMLPILLGFMGLGFDAARAHFIQVRISKAVDQAALAAASSRGTDTERKGIAERIFAANYGTGLFAPPATVNVNIQADGRVDISVDATMETPFASFVGYPEFAIHAEGAAQRPLLDIEIALVVDVSGSMSASSSGGMTRMEALRDAAQTLLTSLQDNIPSNVNVRVAIVPYNVNVNIGTGNAQFVTDTNHALFSGTSWAGCVQEREPPFHITNDYNETASNGSGKWHAYIWPPEPDVQTSGVNSCINPSNGTGSGYASLRESTGPSDVQTAGPNMNCTRQPILPLTSDMTAVETAVANLQHAPNYGTLIAPGVSWGLRVLSPGEPFSEASDFSPSSTKIMIVLTDGEQINDTQIAACSTVNHSTQTYSFDPGTLDLGGNLFSGHGPSDIWTPYGYILDSNPLSKAPNGFVQQADELLVEACNEAKRAGASQDGEIEIYTITFSSSAGPSTSVSAAMRSCASTDNHYSHAPNAGKLSDIFEDIADVVTTTTLVR